MIQVLLFSSNAQRLFEDILKIFDHAIKDSGQFANLSNAYIRLAENLDEETIKCFERMIFSVPSGTVIAGHLSAKRIAASKKPLEEFRNFYAQQKTLHLQEHSRAVLPVVTACLNALDSSTREEAAEEMLKNLDADVLREPSVINPICAILEQNSVKNMLRIDWTILKQAYQMYAAVDKYDIPKIRAVLLGQMVEAAAEQGRRITYAKEIEPAHVSLEKFGKDDYEQYAKAFVRIYMTLIYSKADLARFARIFYHRQCYGGIVSEYISMLKKQEKNDPEKWEEMMALTASYLAAGAEQKESARKEMQRPFMRYMRTLDEDELKRIESKMDQEITDKEKMSLWAELEHKESIQERLGGLFRKI